MSTQPRVHEVTAGHPILFRNATVLTMDPAIGVLDPGDVLVKGQRIEQIGRELPASQDAVVVDGTGGILMPGMVDTHRHMWQTALRGLGADWTLSQYFVFYYLRWGGIFRPEDIYAGNLLSAIESIDAGVTTTVDWSHGLRTLEHGDAAVEALRMAERFGLDPVVDVGEEGRAVPTTRHPIRFSETPATYRLPPPDLDEHGVDVRKWLGDEHA
jgi:5-methylthioadenosine/S-adenosylhomocysteine deaminase